MINIPFQPTAPTAAVSLRLPGKTHVQKGCSYCGPLVDDVAEFATIRNYFVCNCYEPIYEFVQKLLTIPKSL